ncbi:MAG: hypothetical protein ACJ72N_12160 [Labedaea sp.]
MRPLSVVEVSGRVRLAVAAATVLFALAGCSNTSDSNPAPRSSPPSSGTSGAAAIAWMERVCHAAEADFLKLTATPQADPSNPVQSVNNVLVYLGGLSTALGTMTQAMRDAGPPPVANGAQVLQQTNAALESAKKTLDEDRAAAQRALTEDQAGLEQAMNKIVTDMDTMSDPMAALAADKELGAASDKAPACRKLEQTFNPSSTPAAPPS